MNTKQNGSPPPPASITLRDVYYVLFRHKWLISALAAFGLASSAAVYFLWPFPYTSTARVFIRYIQDSTGPSAIEGVPAKVQTPDDRGAGILNTELQILTSRDLALQVATNMGPEKILGKVEDTNNMNAAAAGFIVSHLKAEVQKNCDVIFLEFSAKDPAVAQPVLKSLISAYKAKYVEVHLTPGVSDTYLETKTDESKARLQETMSTLENEKKTLGITSLDDAKKSVADQIARTKESIFQTRAELAEADATVKDLQERVAGAVPNGAATNHSTNLASAALPAAPGPEVVAKYQNLNAILNSSRQKEQSLLAQFTTNNTLVQNAQQQRAAAEADVQHFETQNPGVIAFKPSEAGGAAPSSPASADPVAALRDAVTKQHALIAKYNELTNQLAQVQAEVSAVDSAENRISMAQSERDVADQTYKRFKTGVQQQSIEEATEGNVPNISTIEQPTPPGRDAKKIFQATAGVLGFFLALAFGLPFVIELVLDQSFKHPLDVQARIAAPFFMTFPKTNGHGKLAALKRAKQAPLLAAPRPETPNPGPEDKMVPMPAGAPLASWDERHELRPFFETLRDRLMTYFEMINLTHKPKLVAVTSCHEGAGVTTTAAGLASSLSEIGDGNVLLVNMNVGDGEAHHFYKGKLDCGIEDVLRREKRDLAQVHDNLYVANEIGANDNLPRVLPKRFSHLVPMMKASDYDYIIFDMPPVSQISITPRLARFMDMVLLVIESGKTSRDAAMRAASLLAESKTNVGLVLNKNRSFLPKGLEQRI